MTDLASPLPASFAATRESLRTLACYVIAPARKARTGRIGLRATGDGFGTPPFDDGTRIVVRRDQLALDPGDGVAITTLQAAADYVGLALSPDPGVGADLPPYRPGADLMVDAEASRALGRWYAFGHRVLTALAEQEPGLGEAQLWPEHFDLAAQVDLRTQDKTTWAAQPKEDLVRTANPTTAAQVVLSRDLGGDNAVNVGFSPGDGFSPDPYLYVGPHDVGLVSGPYWNAPFGAVLGYDALMSAEQPEERARSFIGEGLDLLRRRP